ncbi:hypothetical protein [Streptomyces sp. NPDC049879]|uniref:hypothetical protein n=1 Tax=Streptomyces sp. NPDC049879 TaxID=3365598 RepID=UPI0037BE167B
MAEERAGGVGEGLVAMWWGLIVEEQRGSDRGDVATVLEHIYGTCEEAMARLEALA